MTPISNIKNMLSVINRVVSDVILRRIDDRYIVDTNSAITITGIEEEDKCVYLRPNKQLPLYAISINKGGNIPNTISYFERLVETFSTDDDSRLFCFYVKSKLMLDEVDDDFCTKQNLYIYSHSKVLLEEIGNYFNVFLLSPKEIFKSLLDLGLNSRYYNDNETLEIKSYMEALDLKIDEMGFYFKALFSEGVYGAITNSPLNHQMYAYQGVGQNGFMGTNKPNIINALSEKWRGYININFELSSKKVKVALEYQKRSVLFVDPDKEVRDGYKLMLDEYEKSPASYILANVFFVTDNNRCLQKVSEALNVNFIDKKVHLKDILYTTPILSRDGSYDFLMHTRYAKKYIQQVIRKSNVKTMRPSMIAGKDIVGNYTRFSAYESPLPHIGTVAKSRSGKTYFILSLVSGALRAKIVPNENYVPDNRSIIENSPVIISEAPRLGSEVDVVHFDVGYSGIKWINQLKKRYPKKVYINSDDLNFLRFGLTDVKTNIQDGIVSVDKTDSLFLIRTISTLLALNNSQPLTTHEAQAIISKLSQLFAEKKHKSLIIQKMRELGGYDEILAEIEEYLGHPLDDYASLTDFDLPAKYSFLTVPLLSDVIRVLEGVSPSTRVSEQESAVWESAALKLKPLAEDKMFGYYNRTQIPNVNYFYMELESLKKMGDNVLVPVYLMLFQQLYRLKLGEAQNAKNNNKTTKEVLFIMEELHNFTKIEELKDLLETATLEAARYGIVFIFISQNADHYPDNLLLNLGNRVVMPAENEDREEQLKELPKFWLTEGESAKETNSRGVDFFKNHAKRFNAVIKNSNGLFSFMPHSTKEKIWLFNSDAVATEL